MSGRSLFLALSEIGRASLTSDLAKSLDHAADPWPDDLVHAVAASVGYRRQTLVQAPHAQRVRILARALPRCPKLWFLLLHFLHAGPRRRLRDDVLAAAAGGPDAQAVARLREVEGAEVVALAVDAVLGDDDTPAHLAAELRAIAALLAEPVGEVALPLPPADPPAVPSPSLSITEEDAASGLPADAEFTTLDRLLIRSVVSAINGMEGALSRDDLDDLVLELVQINDGRVQSRFHLGFLDALFGRVVRASGAGDNPPRRGWYLCGWLQGVMRRMPSSERPGALDALDANDRALLLDPLRRECGSLLGPLTIPALLEGGRTEDATSWLKAHLLELPPSTIARVVDWSRDALVEGDASAVRRILELVDEGLDQVEARGGAAPRSLRRNVRRRRAIALRCEGQAGAAKSIVKELLQSCNDPAERARLLGDAALLAMGVTRVERLILPAAAGRESLLAGIERARPLLEEAAAADLAVPPALVALALPVVADHREHGEALTIATQRLRRAVDGMTEDSPKFWTHTGLLARARAYLSVLELRTLDASLADRACERLASLVTAGVPLPWDLLGQAVEAASLIRGERAGDLIRAVVARHRADIVRHSDLRQLGLLSEPVRGALSEALVRESRLLRPDERWIAWEGLLHASLAAEPRDLGRAELALDELEQLAEGSGMVERFLRLLSDAGNWEPAWERSDVGAARVRLLSRNGLPEQARVEIPALAHDAIREGDLDLAHELLDQMIRLGASDDDAADLRKRLAAGQALPVVAIPAVRPAQPVRVLFIGGNEVQERYRHALEEGSISIGADLDMVTTGWDSNWARVLDRIEGRLKQAEAIVVMRFVRTQLGRHVRRRASELGVPWIACTGHGHESLSRAIATAVRVTARRNAGDHPS